MKQKKEKLTGFEKRVRERHRRQEAEYGRDEFLFGAEEEEEADIEYEGEKEPAQIGETTAIIADGIMAEQLSRLAGEMAGQTANGSEIVATAEERPDDSGDWDDSVDDRDEEVAYGNLSDEASNAGSEYEAEADEISAGEPAQADIEEDDFDFYDMPHEAEEAAMAAVAAMADSEEAAAIAEAELKNRRSSSSGGRDKRESGGRKAKSQIPANDRASKKTRNKKSRNTTPKSRGKAPDNDEENEESGLSVTDKVLIATGVCVLLIATVSGIVFARARGLQKQIESFASVGTQTENIYIVGEEGLNAVASAKAASIPVVEEELPEIEEEEEPEEIILEEKEIQVVMKVSSVQSDLKIKFSNKSTGKLISGVPFAVTVKSDSGNEYNWKDENKDGLMHHTEVPNGIYSVAMNALPAGEYDNYSSPADVTGVKVTDKIEYKKIDVADEVKSEAEVNVAAEDTAKQDTVVESVLTDTVEWVESTKTLVEGSEDGYKEISKDDVVFTIAKAMIRSMPYYAAVAPDIDIRALGDQPESDNTSSSDAGSANGSSDAGSGGDSTSGDSNAGSDSSDNTETLIPTAGDAVEEVKISKNSTSIDKGQTDSLTVKVVRADGAEWGNVTWSSSNDSVATISGDGTITAIAPGTVTITVASEDDPSKTATCEVTVKDPEKSEEETKTDTEGDKEKETKDSEENKDKENTDKENKDKENKDKENKDTTPLKDASGNQVYIKDSEGNYIEATASDYDKYSKFYIKSDAKAVYIYTGWQTIDGYTYYFDKNGNYVTGDQIIQGAQYSFNSDGHLSTGSGTMGIDVSKWNGSIDWNAVKNSGVSYVIIRCGYRGSTTGALIEDPKFKSNISGARAAGLAVGAYFFTQAVNEVEAVEEASMAVNLCSGYGLSLPLFLDVESSGGRGDRIDSSTRTAVVKAFCQTVRNSGFATGVYANKTWFSEKMQVSQLTNFKIWLAQYAAEPTYTASRIDYWQYSSKGKISGIKGNVDLNIKY